MQETHETQVIPYNSMCTIFRKEFSSYVKISKVCASVLDLDSIILLWKKNMYALKEIGLLLNTDLQKKAKFVGVMQVTILHICFPLLTPA